MTLPPIAHGERLIVVVGPSGAGKDSVLHEWRRRLGAQAPVHFAQRVITRAAGAVGEAHEAVAPAEFHRLLEAGELATAWQANGLHYGVRRRELHALARGAWVVMNGSRGHLPVLRAQTPALHAVEINAPADVRARRLAQRGREDAAAMAQRLRRELAAQAALVLVNDDGRLVHAVDTLHDWWSQQHRGAC